MKYELALKIYEIDYSFIIKNYLDPQMWQKEWTLFVYGDKSFVIYLNSIDTRNKSINFGIRSTYTRQGYTDHDSYTFNYNLGNSNIESLKRQVNGGIESLIRTMEMYMTHDTDEYQKARDLESEHEQNLRDTAERFLDDNGITIEDVREAYIDYYMNKMRFSYTNEVSNMFNHDLLFDVYMVYYKASNQIDKFNDLKKEYQQKHQTTYQDIMEEINEKIEYLETSEYQDELVDNLEDIV